MRIKRQEILNDELTIVGVVLILLVTLGLFFQSTTKKDTEINKATSYYFKVSHWYTETLATNKQLKQEIEQLKTQLVQSEVKYNKLKTDSESIKVLIQIKDDLLQEEIKKKKQ